MMNLTPHTITVYDGATAVASWPPAGPVARIEEQITQGPDLQVGQGRVPTSLIVYGDVVQGLPDPVAGVGLIASRVTAAFVRRPDVFFPADEVRDSNGLIIGCQRLGTFEAPEVGDA